MPTYQYSCTDCGHFFETFQSFSDDSLTVCPECDGKLRKVFNAVGVVFKGSGFYRNDSRSQTSGATESSSSTNGSGSADKGSTTPAKSSSGSDSGSSGGSSGSSSGGSSGSSSSPAPSPA